MSSESPIRPEQDEPAVLAAANVPEVARKQDAEARKAAILDRRAQQAAKAQALLARLGVSQSRTQRMRARSPSSFAADALDQEREGLRERALDVLYRNQNNISGDHHLDGHHADDIGDHHLGDHSYHHDHELAGDVERFGHKEDRLEMRNPRVSMGAASPPNWKLTVQSEDFKQPDMAYRA